MPRKNPRPAAKKAAERKKRLIAAKRQSLMKRARASGPRPSESIFALLASAALKDGGE